MRLRKRYLYTDEIKEVIDLMILIIARAYGVEYEVLDIIIDSSYPEMTFYNYEVLLVGKNEDLDILDEILTNLDFPITYTLKRI